MTPSHLHLVHGRAPVAKTSIEQRAFVWRVPEGLIVEPDSPFDRDPAVEVTYEETKAALERFELGSALGSPIDAMWSLLKAEREEARRG